MNAVELFLDHPALDAASCILTQHAEYSYGELRRAVEAVAAFLAQHAQAGDRIGLMAENSFFLVAAYLGTLRAGAVAVPLPPSLDVDHCRCIVETTEMRGAFLQATAAEGFGPALAPLRFRVLEGETASSASDGCLARSFESVLATPTTGEPAAAIDERRDLAAILFTSGSTGAPRGVKLTHQNLIANTRSILAYLSLEPSDRVMVVLPFYYSFGASLLHTHLAAGATLVIDRRFMFPDRVLERMIETRCTGFAGVPSHYQMLLRRSGLASMRFPDLRWLQQAGGKLATAFIQELLSALPDARLYVMYGATEATARIAYLPPSRLKDKLGSVGRAIPGVTLSVRDRDDREVAPGEVGEIAVEGDNVAQGYWRAPEESAASFRNGRLYTGDLATVDAEGFVYIVDRMKDFLKCGGRRVSSKQLEDTLLGFVDIVEAAVVGIADELLGEAVCAFVVARDPADSTLRDRLAAYCAARLAPHLVPRRVTLLPELPKNSAGKVLKQELRRRALDLEPA